MLKMGLTKILEQLQAEAIEFAEELRSRRNEDDLFDFEKGKKDVQTFNGKVKSQEHRLGHPRRVRILRHQTPAVHGLDGNKGKEVNLEKHISWVEAVQTNIEYELEVIDRKRTLALTVTSAIAASAAAIAAVIALFKM